MLDTINELEYNIHKQTTYIIIMKRNGTKLLTESFKRMIAENPIIIRKSTYGLAELFGRPSLTQSQKIQLGLRMEYWINEFLDKHSGVHSIKGKNKNLWMDIENNKIVYGGSGKNTKDIDVLFTDKSNNVTYYLELKTNLGLDTEKAPATIKKVDDIAKALTNTKDYSEVVGKIISIFWDEDSLKGKFPKQLDEKIMWFGELCELLNLDITKSDYETMCKELGELI